MYWRDVKRIQNHSRGENPGSRYPYILKWLPI